MRQLDFKPEASRERRRAESQNLARRCRAAGINLALVEDHAIQQGAHGGLLLLGYGHLDEIEIRQGVRLLHDTMLGREAAKGVKAHEDC